MILSLRRRRENKKTKTIDTTTTTVDNESADIDVPGHFRCPISLDLMKDPVTLSTGMTYDRDSIEKWIDSGHRTCPATNQALTSFDQIPNHAIRRMIQDWCVQNRSRGVERIPTPRIPPAPAELAAVSDGIAAAAERRHVRRCGELVAKVKAWAAGESQRNSTLIAESRAGSALSLSFEAFSVVSDEGGLLEEILSVLPWLLGLGGVDREARARLSSDAALTRLVSFLRGNDLSSRRNAVLVIKELLSSDSSAESFAGIEGGLGGLVRVIREPICPRATNASLTAIFRVVDKSSEAAALLAELGLVSLLLEAVLEGSERGVCERAARVLDAMCDAEGAREAARENALTIPLVVKRMLRVSDFATECLVSVLWKIVAMDGDDEGVVLAALEVGALEKMLVMLQIGCGERSKEKVKELLKLFNVHRRRLDCHDLSVEFKYLKRSF